MNYLLRAFPLILLLFSFLPTSQAALVQWEASAGGNDHFYELVLGPVDGIDWDDAQADALSKGGYLATLTTASENQFVFDNLINDSNFWVNNLPPFENQLVGPWIGGFQPPGSPEPNGAWEWVNGEGTFVGLAYSNWTFSEPNNFGLGEDRAIFYNNSDPTITNGWNDVAAETLAPSYVIEYTSIPEPTTLLTLVLGIASVGALSRVPR